MLDSTKKELQKQNNYPNFTPKTVAAEKSVLIRKKGLVKGKFDFFVETIEGKLIGVEVLTRPSKGKLKQKLVYSKEVDEFMFVLPERSMELYRKKKKNGLHARARKKFLDSELESKKIFVWLFEPATEKFVVKKVFSKEFNVEEN